MTGVQHREPPAVCPLCGSSLKLRQYENGHELQCDGFGCSYMFNVPYGGYVPPQQPQETDRELE